MLDHLKDALSLPSLPRTGSSDTQGSLSEHTINVNCAACPGTTTQALTCRVIDGIPHFRNLSQLLGRHHLHRRRPDLSLPYQRTDRQVMISNHIDRMDAEALLYVLTNRIKLLIKAGQLDHFTDERWTWWKTYSWDLDKVMELSEVSADMAGIPPLPHGQ